jgi:hypothetical protein
MTEQMTLLFKAQKDAEKWAKRLDRMLEILSDGRWYRASELGRMLAMNDRTIRRLADLSDGRVISGQEGYKLTRHGTNAEIDHAEAWLLSQARKMTDRAREIRVARNHRGVAA